MNGSSTTRSSCLARMLMLASVVAGSACGRASGAAAIATGATATTGKAPSHGAPAAEQARAGVLVNPNRRRATTAAGPGRAAATSLFDWSGRVESATWVCFNHTPQELLTIQCTVDPGYVLVGGGASADTTTGPGAFLTASYPFDPDALTTWEASSKDHGVVSLHVLTVYAIGLKISGMSRDAVRALMYVNQQSAGPASHPVAGAADPSPSVAMLTLGGGARVDWHGAGNLLTILFNGAAASKDHIYFDPSTITTYRILMYPFTAIGEVELTNLVDNKSASLGPIAANVALPAGYVPVGFAAASTYGGQGRMLTRLGPNGFFDFTHYVAGSKDHLGDSAGSLIFSVNFLRKKP
jgi:hypothetical protein